MIPQSLINFADEYPWLTFWILLFILIVLDRFVEILKLQITYLNISFKKSIQEKELNLKLFDKIIDKENRNGSVDK